MGAHESSKDTNICKAQAWTAINKLWGIWKAPQLSPELKLRIFRTSVEAIIFIYIIEARVVSDTGKIRSWTEDNTTRRAPLAGRPGED